jgi:hypothetical protein
MDGKFEDILNLKYRWPKRGDRIVQAISKQTDVYFPEHPFERSTFIWSGYFRAAEVLVEQCEREEFDRNYLTFPIMFCYRHALETVLKYIIEQYGGLVGMSVPPGTHNLLNLWKLHEGLMEAIGLPVQDDGNQAIARVVRDFHEIDKGSFSFRYATDNSGVLISFPSGVVSLATLKDVMEGCKNYFDATDGYYADLQAAVPTDY